MLVWSTNIYNHALGFSCWHVIPVNSSLLPSQLRLRQWRRLGLAVWIFFVVVAVLTTADSLGVFRK